MSPLVIVCVRLCHHCESFGFSVYEGVSSWVLWFQFVLGCVSVSSSCVFSLCKADRVSECLQLKLFFFFFQ